MAKVIKVKKISDASLKRLEARGIKVMVVGGQSEGPLRGLERVAAKALKNGDVVKARSARLQILKLIKGG